MMSVSSADRPWLGVLLNKFTVPLSPSLTGRPKVIEDTVGIHHAPARVRPAIFHLDLTLDLEPV
jgi:hypothetical protein